MLVMRKKDRDPISLNTGSRFATGHVDLLQDRLSHPFCLNQAELVNDREIVRRQELNDLVAPVRARNGERGVARRHRDHAREVVFVPLKADQPDHPSLAGVLYFYSMDTVRKKLP
jgi:hypothetical protein